MPTHWTLSADKPVSSSDAPEVLPFLQRFRQWGAGAVRLILPVGLEKRNSGDIHAIANLLNAPGAQGLRLLPVPGEIVTELDTWRQLTGAQAELIAAGGVCGAEGAVWIALSGTKEQEKTARVILKRLRKERPFSF